MHGHAKKAAVGERELLDKLMESKEAQAKLVSDDNAAKSRQAISYRAIVLAIGPLAVGLGLLKRHLFLPRVPLPP